jgi:protein-S-isoprenylcysteine O-methyltransferase Ste14
MDLIHDHSIGGLFQSMKDRIITSLYKITTGNKIIRILLTPIGGGAFILVSALFILLSLIIDDIFSFPKLVPSPYNLILSLPLLTTGLALILWSSFLFAKSKGTPVPFSPPIQLVSTGPYFYIRNPIVSGYIMIFFGIGFFLGSVSLVLIVTPIYFFLLILEIKLIEEPELEKRLGKDYLDYKKRVPMLIPRLKPKM